METPDHTGNPKASKDYGAQIFHLDCSNTNQRAKLQHALPATRYLLKLQDTLGLTALLYLSQGRSIFPSFSSTG